VRSGTPADGAFLREEPHQVAEAVCSMELDHVVITSVTRDDLQDGGAGVFAETVAQIRAQRPHCTIELLIPDLQGDPKALGAVMEAKPDILGHNMETVPRLYGTVRPQADYGRSLQVLATAKALGTPTLTKSGIMVGLGETREELLDVMVDLRKAGCDILTIGQYLRPTKEHLPVARYYTPDAFSSLKDVGDDMGFGWVESGPLVRSSYHAETQARMLKTQQ
jgi:lipoic acid synthetase